MFRLLIVSAALALAVTAGASGNASTEPVQVSATFGKVYVPGGFDSNDHVQFVGEGIFRNTCYRPAPGSVSVDKNHRTITVGPVAYEYNGFCLQVILPFQRVVDVGILPAGRYDILQSTSAGPQKLGELSVRPSLTDDADDYLYAPISQAFFESSAAENHVILSGEFPNSCMHLEKVVVTPEKDVIVLQPIAAITSATGCHDGSFAFEKIVTLPSVPAGRYLLHVRTMNGNAVNNLINIEAKTP